MEAHSKLSPSETDEIRTCLAAVLASPGFASSEKCRRLLQFVVERTLAQKESLLKESNIAREVFDRPHYDPSEESFVRVRAAEVRRRLADYNRQNPSTRWRIELPTGRYQATFVRNESPATPKPDVAEPVLSVGVVGVSSAGPRFRLKAALLCVAAITVLALGALFLSSRPRDNCLVRVWRPVLQSHEPLLIFVPTPTSFSLSKSASNEWRSGRLKVTADGTLNEPVPQSELVYFPDKVGLGAAGAAVRFSLLSARMEHSSQLRFGRDLALVDLRSRPAVILGAFSSPWAEELNNSYRFRLRAGANGEAGGIVDSQVPGRVWTPQERQDQWPVVDYAIAARILHPVTGNYVFVAAGVYTFGTQSAAEFLTDEQELRRLDAVAPPGWDKNNFQVVLRVNVIGNSPGSPTIVAWKVW